MPHKFTDVTKEVEASVPAGAGDLARTKAIEAKQKALVAACEKTPGMRCSVAAFDGGLQYVLVEAIELTDIRLVYAPPRAIGEFGGEPDNFHWPRHTGDFALGRAYKDGKPYQPEFFFPISQSGVKPGDFVMVLGYPGRTMRSMTAGEMANERDFRFQLRDQIYGEWIRAIEDATKGDAAGAITVAATLKSLNNSHTNAQGQLAGFARGNIIAKQQQHDDAVAAWAAGQPALRQIARSQKGTRPPGRRTPPDRHPRLSFPDHHSRPAGAPPGHHPGAPRRRARQARCRTRPRLHGARVARPAQHPGAPAIQLLPPRR